MKIKRMNLRMFEADTQIIDRSGADTLIPEERAREIIQGVVTSPRYYHVAVDCQTCPAEHTECRFSTCCQSLTL